MWYNYLMKTLLVAINSKYIHSSLAVWYLKACCGAGCGEVGVLESTINDDPGAVLAAIYRERPGAVAFSCYIWNIRYVYGLVSDLKKVLPGLVVILGGPEVSYDSRELLETNPDVDYVIAGEGESGFPKLIAYLNGKAVTALEDIEGLCYRSVGGTSFTAPALLIDLDTLPSPYTAQMLQAVGNRIAYFESSRGCPFNCSYCLSSTFSGVRYFPMERVKRELSVLFDSGVRQVKFVDRTFNCNKARTMEIIRYIGGLYKKRLLETGATPDINFHFEAAADLFDEEMLGLLAQAPEGLFQLEIGVQTVNEAALDAVNRRTDTSLLRKNVTRLRAAGNVNLHLDLIAGLPFEDFASFGKSFDAVYGLRPHQLQLGFLKLLKGTRIRCQADIHGYRFKDSPPYELLSNKYMDFDELLELKGVEELLDRYFNSGRFVGTLNYLMDRTGSPIEFYLGFHRYTLEAGRVRLPAALRDLYALLMDYSGTLKGIDIEAVKEFMRFDFLSSDCSGSLPPQLYRPVPESFRDDCFSFLKKDENIRRYLPGHFGQTAKMIYKKVNFEIFNLDFSSGSFCHDKSKKAVLLFDYASRNRVTGLYSYSQPEGFLL